MCDPRKYFPKECQKVLLEERQMDGGKNQPRAEIHYKELIIIIISDAVTEKKNRRNLRKIFSGSHNRISARNIELNLNSG